MARNNGNFDDDEGFFESLMKHRGQVPMPPSMAKLFSIIAGLVVVIIVGLVAWAVWPSGDQQTQESIPMVRAEKEEYKVKPDEPGGMPIPNKDSTIFESMDASQGDSQKAENILEDEEQPMKKEEVFESEDKNESAADASPPTVTAEEKKDDVKTEPSEVPEEKVAEEVTSPSVVEEKKTPEKEESVIATLKKEAGTADKPKEAAKPVSKGRTYIQFAAVRSEADAKAKWSKLQSTYSVLKPLPLHIQKADLGAKGVFYRVQAGPLSASEATATCAKVKAAKGDCIIAK